MGDIVERLKAIPVWMVGMMAPGWQEHGTAAYKAADEIAALRAENARLREALVNEREENLWNAYNHRFTPSSDLDVEMGEA